MTAQYYAIQTLLQYNIKEFPILVDDIESILLDRGWIIKSYDINSSDYIDIFKRMGVLDIAKYSPAFSIKTDNNMILFYRNNLSNAGKRFALAHELGHDIMGHISAMSVVFCGLILLFIAFKVVGKVAVNLSKRNAMKAKGIDKVEAKELSQAPGEVYAAISMALHEMQDEVHDVEETVLTITRVKRSYSPWSSKIYTLRENPNRK